jgi:hypothetical protein
MTLQKTPRDMISIKKISDISGVLCTPDFQRTSDMEHVNEIYQSIKDQLDNDLEPKLTGCLVTVVAEDTNSTYLLDGNHRLKAYIKILDDGHDLNVYVQQLTVKDALEAEILFNQTNNSLPVADMPKGVMRSHVNSVAKYFYDKYREQTGKKGKPLFSDTPTGTSNRPRISRSKFEKSIGYILDKGISKDDIIRTIESNILLLDDRSVMSFKQKSNDTVTKLTNMLSVADSFNCRLGMILNDDYNELHTMFNINAQKGIHRIKDHITKPLKMAVWNKYCGQRTRSSLCPFCKIEIKIEDFHCAHNTADADGGSTDVDNLYPCCAMCNLSMGKKNFDQYLKNFR